VKAAREAWTENQVDLDPEHLIFIDERFLAQVDLKSNAQVCTHRWCKSLWGRGAKKVRQAFEFW
jgi:hypothetical protein